ncbi:MAG: discoidin domain-containing protein [Armatimonadetes bacterium]|nr:discoidin domain-containing protein [Armatimonadota bacterium]
MNLPRRDGLVFGRRVFLGAGTWLVLGVSSCLWAAGTPNVNLALNRPYTANCGILPGWDGLVDGTKNSDEPPDCFATDASRDFPKTIVIDLGSICQVTRIVVHNSANGNTRQVVVSLSADAKNYEKLREYVFPAGRYLPLVHSFAPRKARFVRLSFPDTWGGGVGGDRIIYLREVEIFGKRFGAAGTSPWPFLAASAIVRRGAAWPTARRYLDELSRPVLLAVFTDGKPDPVLGPDGWLTRALRSRQAAWAAAGVKVQSFSLATDGDQAVKELANLFTTAVPDLLMVVPLAAARENFVRAARQFVEASNKAGVAVIVCLPAPPRDKSGLAVDTEEYRRLRAELLAMAAQVGGAVIDLGAALARAENPNKLLGPEGPIGQGIEVVAKAVTGLLHD